MAAQERPVLLITRPEPGASRFAAAAAARWGEGLRIVVSPLMAPVWLNPPMPRALASGTARGLVFTSAAGVEGLARLVPGLRLPAFCVGAATARAAAAAGHAAEVAGPDAAALVAALAARRPPGPLVHARGAETRGDVAARLVAAGVPVEEAVVYDQVPRPLTDAARTALAGGAPVIAPLFSPRSARLLAAAAADAAAPILLAAISPVALAAAGGLAARKALVADSPDAESLSLCVDTLLAAGRRA